MHDGRYLGTGKRVSGAEGEDRAHEEGIDYEDFSNGIKQEVQGDNHGSVIGVLNQTVRRLLDSHKLSESYVSECVSVYVKHPEVDWCLHKLQSHRITVLVGDRGIGRHTAAVWLLDKLGDVRLREVRREPTEPFNVNDILSDRRAGWILDLRSEDADVSVDLGRSLADDEARVALEQSESYLIVLARTDLWKKIGNGGRGLEFSLKNPSQAEILNSHLQAGKSPLKERHAALWSNNSEVAKQLPGLTPAEVVEWSEDIRSEHFIALKESDYLEIPQKHIEIAIQARTNWFKDLLEWYQSNQSSDLRNFILAAAVLDGCRAGDIYNESQKIAYFLGEAQKEQAVGQRGPGIYELVQISKAVLNNGDYLTFPKSGYARSIIEYFWVDRMHLRSNFMSWLVDTSKKKGGDYEAATFERMGDYILRWCSQRREIGDLEEIIFAWSSNEKLRQSAQDLLSAAAFDPVLGKRVRDKMLTWSKSTDPNDVHVQYVVANACGGPLGAVFDNVMLYRLGYLAESPNSKVEDAANAALGALWNAEYTRTRIRDKITRWLTGSDRSRREVGLSSFVAIANVTNGFREGAYSQDEQSEAHASNFLHEQTLYFFIAGWRSALEKRPARPKIDSAFSRWMDNALISEFHEDLCTQIIEKSIYSSTSAGQTTGNRIAALTRLLFVWAPVGVHDNRASVRDRVVARACQIDPIRQLVAAPYNYETDD